MKRSRSWHNLNSQIDEISRRHRVIFRRKWTLVIDQLMALLTDMDLLENDMDAKGTMRLDEANADLLEVAQEKEQTQYNAMTTRYIASALSPVRLSSRSAFASSNLIVPFASISFSRRSISVSSAMSCSITSVHFLLKITLCRLEISSIWLFRLCQLLLRFIFLIFCIVNNGR